ncbi:hypothetical protein HDF11_002982 [Tunturiibacter psychrotolerans]
MRQVGIQEVRVEVLQYVLLNLLRGCSPALAQLETHFEVVEQSLHLLVSPLIFALIYVDVV